MVDEDMTWVYGVNNTPPTMIYDPYQQITLLNILNVTLFFRELLNIL